MEKQELTWQEAVVNRRSRYALDNQICVEFSEIKNFIQDAQLNAPSAVHSQSARLIVLTGNAHRQHWQAVSTILAKIVPPERFETTKTKLATFEAGFGTILFFEDQAIVQKLQAKHPTYAQTYPLWSQQANAMLQFAIWTGLEAMGLGVSIQHYNPLIDEMVQTNWGAPSEWQLITEMVFGNPVGPPREKELLPLAPRLWFIDEPNTNGM